VCINLSFTVNGQLGYVQYSYVHKVTKMLLGSFYHKHVHPLPADQTPNEIFKNPKLYPYFKSCRGAIDGSHFHTYVKAEVTACYCNHKGGVTQNVLTASDFDLKFVYLLSGWEGSAADSRVFKYAHTKDLAIPQNCYYLADAGFPLCDALMTPYCGKCYHLKEWAHGNQKYVSTVLMLVNTHKQPFSHRPQYFEELFNLCHAQAWNHVVEQIFGVFKCRFALMEAAPEYSSKTQSQFIPALGGIHNFIRIHNPSDHTLQQWRREEPSATRDMLANNSKSESSVQLHEIQPDDLGFEVTCEERDRVAAQ
jgi:hypothetical protein